MSAIYETMALVTGGDSIFDAIRADEDAMGEWIALAVIEINASHWGATYTKAVAYLAAHLYASGPGASAAVGSIGGSVAERRARNWAIRYQPTPSNGDASDEALRTTSYGREFLRLRAQTRRPFLARTV